MAEEVVTAVPQALGAETSVPAIPAITEANSIMALRHMKHLLDVREGRVGNLMDANVTFRDLVKTGLVIKPNWSSPSFPVAPPYIAPDGYNPATDYTPPAAPANVVATGGIGTIILQWDTPGYRNHQYAEVWRSETNSLGSAVLLGTTDTRFYTDAIGSGVTRYYWVRFVSVANITGPYQGVDGVLGQTGQDPSYLISLLQGQISSSELDAALRSRVNLIDGPASLTGSVAARIAEESAQRSAEVTAEAAARTTAIAAETTSRIAAILQESQARALAIDGLTSAISAESETRNTAIANEATSRQTLAAQMRGSYTGSDITQVTQGLLFSERTARATADTALSTSISGLSSTVSSNFATLNAAILEEQSTRATAISAEANSRTSLATQLRGNYTGTDASQLTSGLLQSERLSRITADEALQSQINTISAASSGDFQDLIAAIQEEQTARIAGDNVSASDISTITARLNNIGNGSGGLTNKSLEATLLDDRQARVDGDTAVANTVSSLSAVVNTKNKTFFGADTPTASAVGDLWFDSGNNNIPRRWSGTQWVDSDDTRIATNTAAIAAEQAARSAADSALSTSISSLTTTVNNNYSTLNSAILNEQTARSTADTTITNTLTALQSTVTTNNTAAAAAVSAEASTRASADSAISSQINSIASTFSPFDATSTWNFNGGAESWTSSSWDARGWIRVSDTTQQRATSPVISVAGSSSRLIRARVRRTAGTTWSGRAYFTSTEVGGPQSFSTSYFKSTFDTTVLNEWRIIEWDMTALDAGTSWSTFTIKQIQLQLGSVGDGFDVDWVSIGNSAQVSVGAMIGAAVQVETTARTTAISSLASQITTLQSTVTTNNSTQTAAIQAEATTRASVDTGLLAQYTIKTQVNGYISGFGLASTSNNAAATSEFAVLADTFKIASPTGPGITPAAPFIVRTTATTIGGVAVPVGVYLQDAFIANGTISNAKIANAAIDNAKIANLDAAKITTGFISADRLDASTITAKVLEVAAAKVTGQLTASQINGANLAIRSGQYTGYNWPASGGGFYLGPGGLLMGRYSATDSNSSYFQFDSATGSIYANGFSIVNGNSTFSGQIAVTSALSGARMEINNSVIRVFDAAGVIRVKIGNLA